MVNKKRIYELTEQNTLTDNDVSVVDLSGNTSAKKYKLSTLFNYIKTKLGYGTLTAFNKLYVKSDETGFELKGRASDYTPVAQTELNDLYVELSEVINDEITANKMMSLKGAVSNVIDNVDLDNTPASTDKLIYLDVVTKEVKSVEVGSMGGGSNIATNDLLFTTNSTTDFAGYKATFDNAEVKIIADGNTSGDVPFEITQANGTDVIFKAFGDGAVKVGLNAGKNETGFANTYFGKTVAPNSEGFYNVWVGDLSGQNTTTGNYNACLGYQSGNNLLSNKNTFIGSVSGRDSSTGGHNTFVGYNSGVGISTGANNTIVGSNAELSQPAGTTGCIIIGKDAIADGNNQLVIGSVGTPVGNIQTETVTPTKSLTVKINGVNYKIALEQI
jgi:hypothetical protein